MPSSVAPPPCNRDKLLSSSRVSVRPQAGASTCERSSSTRSPQASTWHSPAAAVAVSSVAMGRAAWAACRQSKINSGVSSRSRLFAGELR